MSVLILFDEFIFNLGTNLVDLEDHTFKAVLSNTAPDAAADDELADITQIAQQFGYLTGGETLTSITWAETGAGTGIWQWSAADWSWTASGGTFGPFRYVVLYDDTSTGDKLVGFFDYGSSISITDGNSFSVAIGASGLIRAQEA